MPIINIIHKKINMKSILNTIINQIKYEIQSSDYHHFMIIIII